jgi:hypothetical protein
MKRREFITPRLQTRRCLLIAGYGRASLESRSPFKGCGGARRELRCCPEHDTPVFGYFNPRPNKWLGGSASKIPLFRVRYVARSEGFELPTPRFVVWCCTAARQSA